MEFYTPRTIEPLDPDSFQTESEMQLDPRAARDIIDLLYVVPAEDTATDDH